MLRASQTKFIPREVLGEAHPSVDSRSNEFSFYTGNFHQLPASTCNADNNCGKRLRGVIKQIPVVSSFLHLYLCSFHSIKSYICSIERSIL